MPEPSSRPAPFVRASIRSAAARFVLAALGLIAAPALVCAAPAGIVAGPAVGNTARFTVDVPAAVLTPLASAPEVKLLAIEGFNMVATPGHTLMPERVVWVAVPPTGTVAVTASAGEARISENVLLATQPLVPRGSAPGVAAIEELAQANRGGAAAPPPAVPLARLTAVTWMRDQRVAIVALAPARYDAARQRLEIASRIDVEVSVNGAAAITPAALAPIDTTVSAGPFEEIYRASLVNYQQGRRWRAHGAGFGRLQMAGLASLAAAVPDTSIYAGRGWVKIAISHSGFYKVTWNQLRNTVLFLSSPGPAIDSLRMFNWPGYPLLPEANFCDSCDFREVALQVLDGNGDSKFSASNDVIYFFAQGTSDWGDHFDPSRPDTEFVNDPYESRNYYYLTIATTARPMRGPVRRIAIADGTVGDPTGAAVPATFRERLHLELDTDYEQDATPTDNETNIDVSGTRDEIFWERWFWVSINQGSTFQTDPFALPGVDTAQPARLRALYWGLTTIPFNKKSAGFHDHVLDVSINGQPLPERIWDLRRPQIFDTTSTTLLTATGNVLASSTRLLTDPRYPTDRVDRIGFAWADVFYPRRFEPVGDSLDFESTGLGDVVYDIGPFTSATPPMVFDITDPLGPVQILNAEWSPSGGAWRLRFRRFESGRRRYTVVPETKISSPLAADVFDAPNSSLENLRGAGKRADYLVIYYDGFRAAADELLRWRRDHLPLEGASAPYDTASVPISALYDQFSGGRTDPTAIRNFLRTIYRNWAKVPPFVTLLGDASYDFKNITHNATGGQPGALLPSYENGFDIFVGRQFDTDDWLLNVDTPLAIVPDFIGGRIPAGDAAKALSYVRDKLIPYESTAPNGLWRNQVMMIADDDKQGSIDDDIGWNHVDQSATLDRHDIPRHMDRDYVYLHLFKTELPSYNKPTARAAVVAGIDHGIALVNYVGHGSPFKIADESVYLTDDASSASNVGQPTVFCAASCDVGKFNDPQQLSLGERLLLDTRGGAVGVVSATELAFSYQNSLLNQVLFDGIFTRSPQSGAYTKTVSASLLATKGDLNSSKYQLMGDAAVRVLLPSHLVEITVTDESGATVTQVSRGQKMFIKGRVLDHAGGAVLPFEGKVDLTLEESTPIDTVPGCVSTPFNSCITYPFSAAPIYRGDAEVHGGLFSASCVVPVDARLGNQCRARAYLTDAANSYGGDGAGSVDYSMVKGTVSTTDHAGPAIVLTFPGASTTVKPDAVLRIDLSDPSGILMTDNTPQNGIIVTLDDNSTQRTDVTSSFRYATNSSTAGTASYALSGLTAGPHRISVSAADNLAGGIAAAEHRASGSIDFTVSENPTLRITRAFLFPNPVRSGGPGGGGTFVVDVPGDSVNVLVRLYTIGGKLIREFAQMGSLGQVQIPWDGLDAEGDRLGLGTYLFRVQANPRDSDGTSSARQRATADGRIVVVAH